MLDLVNIKRINVQKVDNMIDFEEELKRFDFFNIDSSFVYAQNELADIFREVNSILGRIGKEQSKTNMQIEEIMMILDEIKEKDETVEKLEKYVDSSEKEKLFIIKALIEILDEVENLYRLSVKEENESWRQQVFLMWGLIGKILFSIGMTRIDDENTVFNPFLNNITGVKSNTGLAEGIVLEVLKSGYTYKGTILRKSDVIVNKHMKVEQKQLKLEGEQLKAEQLEGEQLEAEQEQLKVEQEQDIGEQRVEKQDVGVNKDSIDKQGVKEKCIDGKYILILNNRVLMRRILRNRILLRRTLGNSVPVRRIIGSSPQSADNLLKIDLLRKVIMKTHIKYGR